MIYSELKKLATSFINHPLLSMREKEKIYRAIKKDNRPRLIFLYNDLRKKITDRLNYPLGLTT